MYVLSLRIKHKIKVMNNTIRKILQFENRDELCNLFWKQSLL